MLVMTPQEAALQTIEMWEDLIHLTAFQMVHGAEHGYRRYRYLRFGVPESEPVPEAALTIQLPMWRRK